MPAGLFLLLLQLQARVPDAPAVIFRTATLAPNVKSVVLPHHWRNDLVKTSRAIYTVNWLIDSPPEDLWALFVPRVSMQADVYLNAHFLGSSGSLSGPLSLNWNVPLYFTLPQALLRAGSNSIAIHVSADRDQGGMLREIYLGPHQTLNRDYHFRNWLDVIAPQWIAIFLLTNALFMGALWFLRREEAIYGWYALGFLVWFAILLNPLVGNELLPRVAWDAIWNIGYGYVAICTAFLILHFLNERAPAAEFLLRCYAFAGLLLFALAMVRPPAFFRIVEFGIWDLGQFTIGAFCIWRMIRNTRGRLGGETTWMLAAGLTMFSFGLHDSLMVIGAIDRVAGYFAHFSAPIVILVFGAILLRRFVAALRGQEALSSNLESRIRERESELQSNYARMREAENARLLAEERARIMRDMHDGLGGVLVSTLAMVELGRSSHAEISDSIRRAIHDLRLMIDSLDPAEGDLLTVLGMYRDRLEPLLSAAGLVFRWHVLPLPPLTQLAPKQVLQILRILQEATNNVVKHAGARSIIVSTGVTRHAELGESLFVEIRDDGQGFSMETKTGRGLTHMHDRAREIGGRCELASSRSGSVIRLYIPLS